MTSNQKHAAEAYVWIWLPDATEPIVCGKLEKENELYVFSYGKNYRKNPHAIVLSPLELPLHLGKYIPAGMNIMHSCLRDAAPDAWGRMLIDYQYSPFLPNELDYLLLSGSNRIGALDFQVSATEYVPRTAKEIYIEDLDRFASQLESGESFKSSLNPLFLHGTSVGGARPKCLMTINQADYIAKFSLSTDVYPIVKAEYIGMKLAKAVGIHVAEVQLNRITARDVLLVQRFDRVRKENQILRKLLLSGLSLLGLNEMEARYASYQSLATTIREKFLHPKNQLTELFKRLVFNVLIGNTDDHARNHAAFWDGNALSLTPAYDLCPQQRVGSEATQAMAIGGIEGNFSTIRNILSISHCFLLEESQAVQIVEHQYETICSQWKLLCDEAGLSKNSQELLWKRAILNDFCLGK